MATVETPWFLEGNYAPVAEERNDTDLRVEGALPPALAGRYLRVGSNPKDGAASHWFFGDGMVHGVRLEGGRAQWYRNRWVRTTKFDSGKDAMDLDAIMDPTASAANTHVICHAGRILALEEGHLPYELTPDLDTVGSDDFGGKLRTAFTAHPKRCPETGELHFFGYGAIPPYLTYHVLDADGRLVHSAPIDIPAPVMMHDFMITRDHAVFMDLPVVFDLDKAMLGEPPIGWSDDHVARVGIVPRHGTNADIRWFEVDPCYVFHPMNAWVDGDAVVCDVGRHESMWRSSMLDFPPGMLHRWRFDLATGAVTETPLDDESHGFPRIDERRVGLANRYGWVAAPRAGAEDGFSSAGVIARYDLTTGTKAVHDLGPTAHPGEFVFVPDPESSSPAEDEGWLLGFVYDAATDRSSLTVLDASAPDAAPVAVVHLPVRVPFGFHGNWVADDELS